MSAIVVRGLERRFGRRRVLAGLLRATSGVVEVLGGSVHDPAVRRRVGLIAHAPSLYPRMTVLENLRFWARMYDEPDIADRGRELMRAVGLDDTDRRPVATYSQGMRQRASVARALCGNPELVLADEPLAGLDADGAAAVTALLARCPTVVIATHDLASAAATSRLELREGTLRPAGWSEATPS